MKERDRLEDLGVNGMIILKLVLKNRMEIVNDTLAHDRIVAWRVW